MSESAQRWQRARALFDDALSETAAGRDAFLARVCGDDQALRQQVTDLLAAHAIAETAYSTAGACQVHGERAGDRIGPYKLLELIGEGGFGTVWMAEQLVPIRRRVALKIVKWGMDTRQVVARFEAERQALAMMDHPNIARVLDAGATDTGRPYFVMELVRGVPITAYSDEARLNPDERLALFIPVCEAVQHAHHKGVIHRDLKPTNVMVTLHDGKPVPKVIDFGIAKALHGQLTDKTVFTGFRQMLGTPEYMAPEQAEMSGLDVDTRADIYSLGVMLYELLTGTKPFDLKDVLEEGWQELVRRIKEVDPDKPSTRISTLGERVTEIATRRRMLPKGLSSAFRGDLDWIVLKAMEKERGRRYETAHALVEDLERHLHDQPVLASPPSRVYRLRKYLHRHRAGVAIGALVALSLVSGLVTASWGYREAKEQSRVAIEERSAAVFARDQERRQKEAAVAAQLAEHQQRQRAEREAEKNGKLVELMRAMLGADSLIAAEYPALDLPPRSAFSHWPERGSDFTLREMLDDFVVELDAQQGIEPELEAELRDVIGRSYLFMELRAKAEPQLARALELLRPLLGEHQRVASTVTAVGLCRYRLDDFAAADEPLREAVALNQRLFGEGSLEVAASLGRLGENLRRQGRKEEAEAVLDEAEEFARQQYAVAVHRAGADSDAAKRAGTYLDFVLNRGLRWDKAAEFRVSQGPFLRAQYGAASEEVAGNSIGAAYYLVAAKRYAEAEPLAREAMEIRAALEPEPWIYPHTMALLGRILVRQGKLAEAEPILVEACSKMQPPAWSKRWELTHSLQHLIELYEQQSRTAEAALWRQRLEEERRIDAEHR